MVSRRTTRRRSDRIHRANGEPTDGDLRRAQAEFVHNQPAAIRRDLTAAREQLEVAHNNGWHIEGGYRQALTFLDRIEGRLPTLDARPLGKADRDRLHSMAQPAVETH